MAAITKSAKSYMEFSQNPYPPQIGGDLKAGEEIQPCTPCYIKASDGKVYMANGFANDEKALVAGWTAGHYLANEPITLWGIGVRMSYSDALLTPGQPLYLGAVAGGLDSAATTGGTRIIAQAISANDIRVVANI